MICDFKSSMVSHFENYINIIRNTFSTWNDLKWAILITLKMLMVGNDTANENIRVFHRWETQQFLGKILFTKGLFLFFVFCILFNLLISIFLFCSCLHINCNILRLRVCLNCFLKTKFFCFVRVVRRSTDWWTIPTDFNMTVFFHN